MNQFLKLAAPGVRSLAPYEPGKPLSELERELGISNAVKLASNENALGPGPKAIAAIHAALKDISRYPDGNGFTLKAALASKHGISADRLTLGNGSNDILELLARAFLTADNEVVFSEHAFAVYPIVTQAAGATARIAAALGDDNRSAYGHDLAAMRDLVNASTRLVFVANPNNPTGTWLRKGELLEFIAAMPDHVLVVVDEAYFEFVQEAEYPNAISWMEQFPNLIVTRTFSKAYGLAGLRIGYGVSSPDVADLLNRVRQPFNVNLLAETAAVAALGDEQYLQRSRQQNERGMAQLVDAFHALKLRYIPSAGNFVCVEVGPDAARINDRLLRAGVIVRPVANYGLPLHLRVTVGLETENQKFIDALDQAIQES